METTSKFTYQEGGVRHPDAKTVDVTKDQKVELKEISKIAGWWSDEGVLGLEVTHGDIVMRGMCETAGKDEPPHCASLKMSDGEYLTEVVGQTSGKIERLTFRTSRGTMITFGNDKSKGSLFKLLQKNHKIAALNLGVGKYLYYIGAHFAFVQFPSPPLAPLSGPSSAMAEEFTLEYTKAIGYEVLKEIAPAQEKKALCDPATYGRFDDYEREIKSSVDEGKLVSIREVILYYSAIKKVVLGYRMKYEIRDLSKISGKIIELKHVAANPMTPTLHCVKSMDEGENIISVKGKKNMKMDAITYLELRTNLGKVAEAGCKDEGADIEDFELKGKEGEIVIAFAGKVTDALNSLTVFGLK